MLKMFCDKRFSLNFHLKIRKNTLEIPQNKFGEKIRKIRKKYVKYGKILKILKNTLKIRKHTSET